MSDISKCWDVTSCKICDKCYRNTASSSAFWQSYTDFRQGRKIETVEDCEHFWYNEREDNENND